MLTDYRTKPCNTEKFFHFLFLYYSVYADNKLSEQIYDVDLETQIEEDNVTLKFSIH